MANSPSRDTIGLRTIVQLILLAAIAGACWRWPGIAVPVAVTFAAWPLVDRITGR